MNLIETFAQFIGCKNGNHGIISVEKLSVLALLEQLQSGLKMVKNVGVDANLATPYLIPKQMGMGSDEKW